MGTKWTPNGTQMGPKRTPNGPQMEPKWAPNGAQMGPKWTPKGTQMGLKWDPKWARKFEKVELFMTPLNRPPWETPIWRIKRLTRPGLTHP